MIPKILHFIWIGPQERPDLYDNYLDDWRRLHPDWQFHLWDEEKLSKLDLVNENLIRRPGNWLLRADVIRLELMAQIGGIYVDCDYQPLRSLEDLVKFPAFAVSLHNSGHSPFTNSIFGARPEHPMFLSLVQKVGRNIQMYSSSPLWAQAGGGFFSDYVLTNRDVIRLLPPSFLLGHHGGWAKPEDHPETFAVHQTSNY